MGRGLAEVVWDAKDMLPGATAFSEQPADPAPPQGRLAQPTPTPGHWARSGDIFGCPTWGGATGTQQAEARGAGKHHNAHTGLPTAKSDPARRPRGPRLWDPVAS